MIAAILAAAVAAIAPPQGGVQPNEQAAYDAMVAKEALSAADLFRGGPCKDATASVARITPVELSDNPNMVAWREKVKVEGCGAASMQNLNIGRVGGKTTWKMSHGLPGDSLADTNLQESVLPAFVAQTREAVSKSCSTTKVSDIYLAARPGEVEVEAPGAPPATASKVRIAIALPGDLSAADTARLDLTSAWMEVWPLKACDQDRTMGIVFIPTKDGGQAAYLFISVWQQVLANGPGAMPGPVQ